MVLRIETARAGETLASTPDAVPFEAVSYFTEPVVTIAVEPKYSRTLPWLLDTLNSRYYSPTIVYFPLSRRQE